MERLLDVKVTAELLGIKPVTLRLWISQKKVPYYKVGKSIKFKPSEIETWINATRVEPDPDRVDKQVDSILGIRYEKERRQSDLKHQVQKEGANGPV